MYFSAKSGNALGNTGGYAARQLGGRKTMLTQMLSQLLSCISTIHPCAQKDKKPQEKIPWDFFFL